MKAAGAAWPGRVRMDSVTLFTHLGEDEDGVARYGVTRLDGVMVYAGAGVKQGRPGDGAVVYVFPGAIRLRKEYVPEDIFDEMAGREDCFTVHTDGRDRLTLGMVWEDAPPKGARTLRPVAVKYRDQGRPGLHHIKITCL